MVLGLAAGVEVKTSGVHPVDVVSRPAFLAAELARAGAEVVVVGGTASWLRSKAGWPRDLDVVVADGEVARLVQVLRTLGVQARTSAVLDGRAVRLSTAWGPLDVFVDVPPPAQLVGFDGIDIAVKGAG